jgi:hypothetical protein
LSCCQLKTVSPHFSESMSKSCKLEWYQSCKIQRSFLKKNLLNKLKISWN